MSHHAMLSKYGNSKCLLKIKNKLKSVVLQIQSGKILNILWAFSIKLFHSHLLEMIIANSVLHTSLAIYHLISRVRTHLERPWRSSDFEIKIQGLESSWKLQSVVESPWISGLTFQTPILNCIKGANTERPSGWNCSCCGGTKKDRLKALFSLNGVLESPWKVLEISVQKRVQTLHIRRALVE